MTKPDVLEQKVIQLISTKGTDGILQCNLWRELGASSREGSRLSIKLEKKNLIMREKELFNGRWTYRIFLKKRLLDVDSMLDIPCVSCPDISKCEEGSEISPNLCIILTSWLSVNKQECEEE